jgi:hypothetical protein
VIRRWVVALEDIRRGELVLALDGEPIATPFTFHGNAIAHCNWKNGRNDQAGVRWVVIDRRSM